MNIEVDVERLLLAQKAVRAELLAERDPGGYWAGQIGSSPVATAAAVSALVTAHHQDSDDALRETAAGGHVIEQLVQGDLSELLLEGVHWLARRQNDDGGWGDCDGAQSNIAATMLVQAAFRLTGIPAKYADLMVRADQFVTAQGGLAGLRRQFSHDRTYLTSVLANCALADMVAWRQVPALPFEWLLLPKRWRNELPAPASRLAAPIVMAVGLAKFHNDPPRNPLTRLVRRSLRKKTLACLERLQAADDSFLASPLTTAFVVMSLADMGYQEHPLVERGIEFLLSSVRADASWSVTPNLATTNTALALESLAHERLQPETHDAHWSGDHAAPGQTAYWQETATADDTVTDQSPIPAVPDDIGALSEGCVEWLLKSQHSSPSVLTDAPSGGWGASDALGAEPNTLATAGALQALALAYRLNANAHRGRIDRATALGVDWLLAMQNDDGGWPTYCRAEDSQLLDVSGVDPTAVAIRTLVAWQDVWKPDSSRESSRGRSAVLPRIGPAIERAYGFLESAQRDDGSFVPLWFGNEHQPEDRNPVLGTAQVLAACAALRRLDLPLAQRASAWLVAAQHVDGGWGPPRAPLDYSGDEDGGFRAWRAGEALAKYSSVEETSAAVAAPLPLTGSTPVLDRSLSRGLAWLTNAVEQDAHRRPAIVGFYFSRIWYYERLYPLALATGTLSRAVDVLAPVTPPATVSAR